MNGKTPFVGEMGKLDAGGVNGRNAGARQGGSVGGAGRSLWKLPTGATFDNGGR